MQDLSRHLKEAININKIRMPLYGELSNGATIPFSKKLIRYEKIALLGAWIFDRKGDALQQKGIPYLRAEFTDMALTPSFSNSYPSNIDFTKSLNNITIDPFKNTLRDQINYGNYSEIVETSQFFLDELKEQKHLYCLLRHLVESLARIAYLIPLHIENCDKLKIKAPTNYSRFLLKSHLYSLKTALQMDEAIAPIQNQGIPFLFQDLPPIEIKGAYS